MNNKQIDKAVQILKKEISGFVVPIVTQMKNLQNNKPKRAFRVLISTILSLRTKDETTQEACDRLFAIADTPEAILKLPVKKIEKLIYPVGFYRNKAKAIKASCRRLIDEFDSIVPKDIDILLTFKGVGRKTANLVLSHGWDLPAICVDIHVHRITNRWGYVKTKSPDETEFRLREILPKKHWNIINDLLVTYGQNLCRPISPFCSRCKIKPYCKQIGVTTTR